MTEILTIQEAKDFLKVTDEIDHELIKNIIFNTQELIEKILDKKLSSLLTTSGNIPGDLKLVWLSFIAHVYDERSIENIINKNKAILVKYQKIYI